MRGKNGSRDKGQKDHRPVIGDALVFTDTVPTPNGDMTIAFRYELRDDGRRVHAVERLRGAGREQDNEWVFDRAV